MIFITAFRRDKLVIFKRPGHGGFRLTKIERLHEVIESTQAQCVDGAFDCLHSADHDNHSVRRDSLNVRNHFQSLIPLIVISLITSSNSSSRRRATASSAEAASAH